MPSSHQSLSAREKANRIGLGGMAAEVKHQNMLKCFDQRDAVAFLVRIIEFAFGKTRDADLLPARQESPRLHLVNVVSRSPGPSIAGGFVCR